MIEVTAAILSDEAGRILICQRGTGDCAGLWEFPGGKRERGEDWPECLVRECREELGVQIEVGELYDEFCYAYPRRTIHFRFYDAKIVSGELSKCVHTRLVWVEKRDMKDYEFCPADERLIARLSSEHDQKSDATK